MTIKNIEGAVERLETSLEGFVTVVRVDTKVDEAQQ